MVKNQRALPGRFLFFVSYWPSSCLLPTGRHGPPGPEAGALVGAASEGRPPTAVAFAILRRCVGPPRAGHFGLRAESMKPKRAARRCGRANSWVRRLPSTDSLSRRPLLDAHYRAFSMFPPNREEMADPPTRPPGPPAETTTPESRQRGPGRLERAIRRGGPLRSTAAELVRVQCHELPDAHRRPTGHPLHPIRQPVVPARPVQLAPVTRIGP